MSAVAVMHSGLQVDVAAPHASMFRLRDIGAHLAKQCMYAGAPHQFYSRAQHAVILATEMLALEGPVGALYGLMENAHFAIETRDSLTAMKVARAIHDAVDLDWPTPEPITKALLFCLKRVELAEITQLMTGWEERATALLIEGVNPLRKVIKPMSWDRAMDAWISALRSNAVAAHIPHLPAFGDLL